jgi:2-dehydropantoate 2-reductase
VKVCVFGAGAIGGMLGVALADGGAEVSAVARGAHLSAMRSHGIRLQIEGAEKVAHVRCTDDPADLGEQDYVIIALKAHDIPAAVDFMVPLLGPETHVVTASNGLPYWYFQGSELADTTIDAIDPGRRQWQVLGPERAIGCVVFPAAEVTAPGVIRHEHGRKFPIGEPDGTRSPRLEQLQEVMVRGGLEAPIRDDIRDEIWLKLCGNVCFNPVSALTHATVDIVATDPGTRSICRAMMEETRSVGECFGARMRVDVERRLDGAAAIGAHRMSMLQDLERGRSMEIEPLVGVVQELGRITGTPTPTIDLVLALIRQRALAAPSRPH